MACYVIGLSDTAEQPGNRRLAERNRVGSDLTRLNYKVPSG